MVESAQSSARPGLIAAVVSLQSLLFETYPVGTVQATLVVPEVPYPSPSESRKNVNLSDALTSTSVALPLQLLSTVESVHSSAAPGLIAAFVSSQSTEAEADATKPAFVVPEQKFAPEASV